MRYGRWLVFLMAAGLLAKLAWGETVEFVTTYPSEFRTDHLAVHTLAVGGPPPSQTLLDGMMWVERAIGIRTDQPEAMLDVRGGRYILGGNGDADGDGSVTASDVAAIEDSLSRGEALPPAAYARADLNGDGLVTALDAFLLSEVASGDLAIDDARLWGKGLAGAGIYINDRGNVRLSPVLFALPGLSRLHVAGDPLPTLLGGKAETVTFEVGDAQPRNGSSFQLVFEYPNSAGRMRRYGLIRPIASATTAGRESAKLAFLLSDGVSGGLEHTMRLVHDGNASIGSNSDPRFDESPANRVDTGNLEVHDLFIRAADDGNGRWASQWVPVGTGGFLYEGFDQPLGELRQMTFLVGQAAIGTSPTTVSWTNTPFVQMHGVFLSLTEKPDSPDDHVQVVSADPSSFTAQLASKPQVCHFIVIGEGR